MLEQLKRKALQDFYLQNLDRPTTKEMIDRYQALETSVMESLKEALELEGIPCCLVKFEQGLRQWVIIGDPIGTGGFLSGDGFYVYAAPRTNQFKVVVIPLASRGGGSLVLSGSFLEVAKAIRSMHLANSFREDVQKLAQEILDFNSTRN